MLSFYNRRLSYLAQRKMAAGVYGARNNGWRMLLAGFLPDASAARIIFRGLRRLVAAEWRNLFLRPKQHSAAQPAVAEPAVN